MKKLFAIAVVMLLFAGLSSAQTSAATTAPAISAKAKMMCKTWQIKTTEAWGVESAASEAQKKDLFYLGEDGNCRFIWEGVAIAGKWTIDKSNTWMVITAADGTKTNIKVTSITDTELKVDYKDKSDQHNIVVYSPVTTTGN